MSMYSFSSPVAHKKQNSSVFNIVIYSVALAGLGLIIYFSSDLLKALENIRGKSAITIESANQEAEVFINGESVGKTPIKTKDIKPGEKKISLKTTDRQYETTIDVLPYSEAVVKRDMGVSESFSSGQSFWIEKAGSNTVLSITSEPANASVFIDNTEVGKTPFSSGTLTSGDYDLRIESPGFEGQFARINVKNGYNLNISVKLFPIPVPTKVSAYEGNTDLYDLSHNNTLVTADPNNWSKAVVYWNTTRGINLAELGVNKEAIFDYFIDYKGSLYDNNGTSITISQASSAIQQAKKGGYLGKTSDGQGLSEPAKQTLEALNQSGLGVGAKTAKIKETGTGWLRVRDVAGLNGVEVARVDVGGSYAVLEEQDEWVKVRVSDSVSGWVSKTYVEIN
jgi:hypothetical protein